MPRILSCNQEYYERARLFIVDILVREFSLELIQRPDIEDIPGTYQTGDGAFWIALDRKRIAATMGLQDYGSGRARMRRFMVTGNWRGKGLAQKLLAKCIEHVKKKRLAGIYLSTVPELRRANRFYEKMGFQRIPKPDWFPETEDSVFFVLHVR